VIDLPALASVELIECAWCPQKAEPDDICKECGGCPTCCCDDMHCQYCTLPFGVCTCQNAFGPLNNRDDWDEKVRKTKLN
jgi:hypothetical protein